MGKTKRSRRSQTSLGSLASIQSSWSVTDPRMHEHPTRERRGSVLLTFNLKVSMLRTYVTLDR